MVVPLSYVGWLAVYICDIKLFWLRYLSCFRHSDKSGYGFPKIIHHILGCNYSVMSTKISHLPRCRVRYTA